MVTTGVDTCVFVVMEGKACIRRRRLELHITMMGMMVIMVMATNPTDDASFIKHIPLHSKKIPARQNVPLHMRNRHYWQQQAKKNMSSVGRVTYPKSASLRDPKPWSTRMLSGLMSAWTRFLEAMCFRAAMSCLPYFWTACMLMPVFVQQCRHTRCTKRNERKTHTQAKKTSGVRQKWGTRGTNYLVNCVKRGSPTAGTPTMERQKGSCFSTTPEAKTVKRLSTTATDCEWQTQTVEYC